VPPDRDEVSAIHGQLRLTLDRPIVMCPFVRATSETSLFAGQELNIAQHARRQAAREAALAPRFFC